MHPLLPATLRRPLRGERQGARHAEGGNAPPASPERTALGEHLCFAMLSHCNYRNVAGRNVAGEFGTCG